MTFLLRAILSLIALATLLVLSGILDALRDAASSLKGLKSTLSFAPTRVEDQAKGPARPKTRVDPIFRTYLYDRNGEGASTSIYLPGVDSYEKYDEGRDTPPGVLVRFRGGGERAHGVSYDTFDSYFTQYLSYQNS